MRCRIDRGDTDSKGVGPCLLVGWDKAGRPSYHHFPSTEIQGRSCGMLLDKKTVMCILRCVLFLTVKKSSIDEYVTCIIQKEYSIMYIYIYIYICLYV